MNKEKEKLMNELFGKATKLDINDVIVDSSEDLKKIISINEENLKELQRVTPKDTYTKIDQEVKKDFDLSSFQDEITKDYKIDPSVTSTVLDKESSLDVFNKIENNLKEMVIGQGEAIKELTRALRRPYLKGHDISRIKETIVIEGQMGLGKRELVEACALLLKKEGLLRYEEPFVIDLERYRSSTQENLFIQDLYSALSSDKLIVFENSELVYPVFGRMLLELVTEGSLHLSKRYIINKDQLVDVGNNLDKRAIDHLDGNDKIIVFLADKASKLSDVYGKSFMEAIDDVVTLTPLKEDDITRLNDHYANKLIDKTQSEAKIKVTISDKAKDEIKKAYDKMMGHHSLMDVYQEIYDMIIDQALIDDIDSLMIDYQDKLVMTIKDKDIDLVFDDDHQKERAEIQKEFDEIVGLKKVKEYLLSLEDHIRVSKIRKAKGLKSAEVTKHMIFTGGPGTGKTTIARLISRLMKCVGILSQGQLVEVTRADLVAKYVGQTAPQTMDVINSALGGVLFIDEAYSLYRGKDDSFGLEAIDTLVKAMEDHRDDLIVILAGYSKEMDAFLKANSGLKSRFPNIIHFDDYTAQELVDISKSIAKSKDYKIDEEAIGPLYAYYDMVQKRKDIQSGNGRMARNIVEEAILNQAKRILNDDKAPIDLLTREDFVLQGEDK